MGLYGHLIVARDPGAPFEKRRRLRRTWGLWLLLLAFAAGGLRYLVYLEEPLITAVQLPAVFHYANDYVSANVTGALSRRVRTLRYRVNDGPWRAVNLAHSRAPWGQFTAEMRPGELKLGENRIVLRADARLRPGETATRSFRYDAARQRLPMRAAWAPGGELEPQDGIWERVTANGEARVRPKPGFEGYDRILLVTAPFEGGRRIETSVVFRRSTAPDGLDWGFGVLALWGGHPDDWTTLPRRGWSFGLGWYWSKPGGVGNEISYRRGPGTPRWVNGYRDFAPVPDQEYALIIEAAPELGPRGEHLRYRQRLKWWPSGRSEPAEWQELSDAQGVRLPEGEYAVALLSLRAQVEFGPVSVSALPPFEACIP